MSILMASPPGLAARAHLGNIEKRTEIASVPRFSFTIPSLYLFRYLSSP